MNRPERLISSPSNPRIKELLRLERGRHRVQRGLMLVEGTRELARACDAGCDWESVYICDELIGEPQQRAVVERLRAACHDSWQVTQSVYERLRSGERNDGVIAVAHLPRRTLADLRLPDRPLVVVVEGVEKPGNVGAILRTADAAGVAAVIVADGGTDLYNRHAIRASLGALFTVPTVAAGANETRQWLLAQSLQLVVARVGAAVAYSDIDYRRPTAIVLGSEARGLSDVWSGADVTAVGLPMLGRVDSLNVSATTAVLCYEALRQRSAGAVLSAAKISPTT